MHEVVNWNGYSEEERRKVIGRISSLVRQVAEPIIEISDDQQLLENLRFQNLRIDESADPYLWLLELLKLGANNLENLEQFGCSIRVSHQHLTLKQIRDLIDRDFYTLSEVHYERYFARSS